MQAVSFSCPHCSVVLRLQDRMFVGKEIDCPDCGAPIEIVADAKESITAEKRTATKTQTDNANDKNGAADSSARPLLSQRLAGAAAIFATPVGVAWTIAGVFAVSMIAAVWPSDDATDEIPSAKVAAAGEHGESDVHDATEAEVVDESKEIRMPRDPARDLMGQRFKTLGQRIQQFVERNEQFPKEPVEAVELPLSERLGWLAQLTAETGTNRTLQPLWDRSWRDPLNDRFVRQRIREFQNPLIAPIVSPEGYPASHIVGISGVGENAEKYPIHDSRAGIFGLNRRTRLDDVSDGLSNTMMAAGIQKDVGAWAAAGPATMRSLTRQPYVNGPDGFGTGQHDGMMVLMADGSVRFVSKKTEPIIVRRMAAMADGFPLDPKVPGEPGDKSIPIRRDPAVAGVDDNAPKPKPADGLADADVGAKKKKTERDPPDKAAKPKPDEPIKPLVQAPAPPPEPQKVDVKAALSQKIVSFRQSKPVSFATLLLQVEEMAGVPIRHGKNKVRPEILRKEVSVSLTNTTVGAILDALVERVGLAYEMQDTGILLIPRDSSPSGSN